MPRINLIGASNLHTNNACQYGSMAGLAPTATVRPNVTGLPGYKADKVYANQHNNDGSAIASNTTAISKGCGIVNQKDACSNGRTCLTHLNLLNSPNTIGTFKTGRSKLLG